MILNPETQGAPLAFEILGVRLGCLNCPELKHAVISRSFLLQTQVWNFRGIFPRTMIPERELCPEFFWPLFETYPQLVEHHGGGTQPHFERPPCIRVIQFHGTSSCILTSSGFFGLSFQPRIGASPNDSYLSRSFAFQIPTLNPPKSLTACLGLLGAPLA